MNDNMYCTYCLMYKSSFTWNSRNTLVTVINGITVPEEMLDSVTSKHHDLMSDYEHCSMQLHVALSHPWSKIFKAELRELV